VVDRITARADRLTPAERKVAAILAGEPQSVAFGTVATVADKAGTSGPSVVRLAVHGMPHSGKPAELLAEAGIDADGIAAAARSLARTHAGAS